jgi:hypothetical protein
MSKNNPLSGGTRDSSIMGVSGLNGIATLEYPNSYGLNPMSLWDFRWVKELDDETYRKASRTVVSLMARLRPSNLRRRSACDRL